MQETLALYFRSIKKPNTRRKYMQVFNEWLDFLGKTYRKRSHKNLIKATSKDALNFVDYISSKNGIVSRYNPNHTQAANSTVALKIRVLKKVTGVLVIEKALDRNVWLSPYIKLPDELSDMKRPTVSIPSDSVKKFFDHDKTNAKERQAACLAKVLLAGALRLSEALNLTLGDVDTLRRCVILRKTKAGKDVEHPLAEFCWKPLLAKLAHRKLQGAKESDRLFVTYSATGEIMRDRYVPETARRHIKERMKEIGLPNCSSHSFRKTFANEYARKETNPRKVQAALRLSSLQVAERYLEKENALYDNTFRRVNFSLGK